MHMKTLIHYVQELGCVNVLESIAPRHKHRIYALDALCVSACNEFGGAADLNTQVQLLLEKLQKKPPTRA